MSLKIIKAGILDTVQDLGRFGYQHLGINCNGVMDLFSAQLANALLGKNLDAPVLEIHFPASTILFEKETIICITGADFSPVINGKYVPINHPIIVNKNSQLQFKAVNQGVRCYLSILDNLKIEKWLNSYSTNLKACAGGWQGRALQKEDRLPYEEGKSYAHYLQDNDHFILPWKAVKPGEITSNEIEFIIGNEWSWLTKEAQNIFGEEVFQISNVADRMGYRLTGKELEVKEKAQLISSAVSFGTVQLLPNGQLIVLMADHQTTGGYPRIAHIITAHLPVLAQMQYNNVLRFKLTTPQAAEEKLVEQQKYLLNLQTASKLKLENLS